MNPRQRRHEATTTAPAFNIRSFCTALLAAALAMCSVCAAASNAVNRTTSVRAPPHLRQRVDFRQNLNAQVPMGLAFRNAQGRTISVRQAIDGKPTVLVPGYYDCPNLCSIVRTGVAHAVAHSGFVPGKQFNVVLVSINPREGPATARRAQHEDEQAHPHAHVANWDYLTGAQAASASLMHAIGFRYFYDKRNGQYDHAAGIVLLTPSGKVSQYLFGVKFPSQTLRLSLVNASHGKIGSIVDRLLLLCCHYDLSTGRYTLTIHRVMQMLGVLTVLVLIGLIWLLMRSERRRAAALRQHDADGMP